MTLRQLEYLVAVAQTGSFTLAAAQLHVSQPTLSQQIRALELEVGTPLIERLPRAIRLTPAGRAMLGDAHATLASARRVLSSCRRAVTNEPQTITLATVRSLAAAVLPATVKRWHDLRPEVSISMLEFASRKHVVAAVQDGRADLGIGPLPEDWSGARVELGWEQMILVLPSNDPLARTSGDIRLEALARRDWVLYEEGHGLGEMALAACHAAGFEPQCAVLTAQVEVAARMAAAGIGPTLVPVKNVPPDLMQNVRGIDPAVTWRVWAYTLADEFSSLNASFADVLVGSPWQRRAIAAPDGAAPPAAGWPTRSRAARAVSSSRAIS